MLSFPSLKTYFEEIKEEFSAVESLRKLNQVGIDRQEFILSTKNAMITAPEGLSRALGKVVNAYGLSRKYSSEGKKVVDSYFDKLEGRAARMERNHPTLAKLHGQTTSWFAEMASFAVVLKGMIEVVDRQGEYIDANLRASGKLEGLLQKNISAPFERASVVAREFNVDSEQVAKAAIEFVNRFGRGATLLDLEKVAGIAKFTGRSYDEVWGEIVDRSKNLGETFSSAAAGVQNVIAAQHELEVYEHKLGVPRENILGAQEFAEMMKRTRETGKDLPKDSRILDKVVVETLKRVYGVDSKEQKELVAENMAKIIEADPMIAGQLGEEAERRVKAEADRVIQENGGDYDKDQAEVAAINRIFGKAYSAQAQALFKAQKQGLSRYSVMMELGSLYSKIPRGQKEAMKLTSRFATVGGTSGQAAEEFFRSHGVDQRVIPQFIDMAMSGKLDEVAEEVGKIDSDLDARVKNDLQTTSMVLGKSLPAISEVAGTIKGGWDILTTSPWTKILAGMALLTKLKLRGNSYFSGLMGEMSSLERRFYEIAIAKGDEEAVGLLKNMKSPRAGGKMGLAKRLVSSKWVKGGAVAAVLGGTGYEILKSPPKEEPDVGGGMIPKTSNSNMMRDVENVSVKMTSEGINNATRKVADRVGEIELSEVRSTWSRGQDRPDRTRQPLPPNFKPTVEITNIASLYVQGVAKVGA